MLDPIITLVVPLNLFLLLVLLRFLMTLPGYNSILTLTSDCLICSLVVAFWLGIPFPSEASCQLVILSNPYLVKVYLRIGIFGGRLYLWRTAIYLWGPPCFTPFRTRLSMVTLFSFRAVRSLALPQIAPCLPPSGMLSLAYPMSQVLCFVCLDLWPLPHPISRCFPRCLMFIIPGRLGSSILEGIHFGCIPHLRPRIVYPILFLSTRFILRLACLGCFSRHLYFVSMYVCFLFRCLFGWRLVSFVHCYPVPVVSFWWISFNYLVKACVSYIQFPLVLVRYFVVIVRLFCFLCVGCSLWFVYHTVFIYLSVI